MKPELQDELYAAAPTVYRKRHLPMNQTCMCWGIECGSGWFKLLMKLSKGLQEVADEYGQRYPELARENLVPVASQVKEKFGELRFYYTGPGDTDLFYKCEELINEAEEESAHTCETCGASAKTEFADWSVTLCESCLVEYGQRRAGPAQ